MSRARFGWKRDAAMGGWGSGSKQRQGRSEREPANRGNWHRFEPLTSMVERYVVAFASPTPPHLPRLAEAI